jgi:hypothetical protein
LWFFYHKLVCSELFLRSSLLHSYRTA